ncbi:MULTISPECIES: hypothetical protein [unclassified Mesorhizobium]|uniref:hypothetical protein n=1 Tax=unclassified Mesorhizobium TaxID=325217 RepID=UPI0015CAA3E1|nr:MULTISPECIES: hypothetical protein [unclassified Mesorhizobium]
MTEKQRAARQKAFEKGQQATREDRYHNNYPPISPDHDWYDQGYQKEMETIFN